MARKAKSGGRKGEIIGEYTTKRGQKITLHEYTPKQKKKVKRKSGVWANISHKKLERQAIPIIMLGGFFAVLSALMILGGFIMMPMMLLTNIDSTSILWGFIIVIIGAILFSIFRSILDSGMARLKWMVLNPEKEVKTSKEEIKAIAERFLSGP